MEGGQVEFSNLRVPVNNVLSEHRQTFTTPTLQKILLDFCKDVKGFLLPLDSWMRG